MEMEKQILDIAYIDACLPIIVICSWESCSKSTAICSSIAQLICFHLIPSKKSVVDGKLGLCSSNSIRDMFSLKQT